VLLFCVVFLGCVVCVPPEGGAHHHHRYTERMAAMAEAPHFDGNEDESEVEVEVEVEVVNGVAIVGKVSHADARGDLPLMRELRDLLFAPIEGRRNRLPRMLKEWKTDNPLQFWGKRVQTKQDGEGNVRVAKLNLDKLNIHVQLPGLAHFFNQMPMLEHLDLRFNEQIQGEIRLITPCLGRMTYLALTKTGITGHLSDITGPQADEPKFEKLRLASTHICGTLADLVVVASTLTELSMSDTDLEGDVSDLVVGGTKAVKLKNIGLRNTGIYGELSTLLEFAPNMAVLAAENTKITSAEDQGLLGLASAIKTTNLKTLKLTNTLIKVSSYERTAFLAQAKPEKVAELALEIDVVDTGSGAVVTQGDLANFKDVVLVYDEVSAEPNENDMLPSLTPLDDDEEEGEYGYVHWEEHAELKGDIMSKLSSGGWTMFNFSEETPDKRARQHLTTAVLLMEEHRYNDAIASCEKGIETKSIEPNGDQQWMLDTPEGQMSDEQLTEWAAFKKKRDDGAVSQVTRFDLLVRKAEALDSTGDESKRLEAMDVIREAIPIFNDHMSHAEQKTCAQKIVECRLLNAIHFHRTGDNEKAKKAVALGLKKIKQYKKEVSKQLDADLHLLMGRVLSEEEEYFRAEDAVVEGLKLCDGTVSAQTKAELYEVLASLLFRDAKECRVASEKDACYEKCIQAAHEGLNCQGAKVKVVTELHRWLAEALCKKRLWRLGAFQASMGLKHAAKNPKHHHCRIHDEVIVTLYNIVAQGSYKSEPKKVSECFSAARAGIEYARMSSVVPSTATKIMLAEMRWYLHNAKVYDMRERIHAGSSAVKPAHTVFVLDESTSMRLDWAEQVEAFRQYVLKLYNQGYTDDIISVVQYASEARVTCERKGITEIPTDLPFSGGRTVYASAMAEAESLVNAYPADQKTVIVFVTDGPSTSDYEHLYDDAALAQSISGQAEGELTVNTSAPRHEDESVVKDVAEAAAIAKKLRAAKGDKFQLHTVAFGPAASAERMEQLSRAAGGRTHVVHVGELGEAFVRIASTDPFACLSSLPRYGKHAGQFGDTTAPQGLEDANRSYLDVGKWLRIDMF